MGGGAKAEVKGVALPAVDGDWLVLLYVLHRFSLLRYLVSDN